MDPNQWRNPLHSFGQGIPRLDPYIVSEQQNLSVGSIPAHTPLTGTGLVQGLTGNPSFPGPYKPTALSPFGIEGTRIKEPDHFGLGLSPQKSLLSPEDKGRSFGQVNFSQPSLTAFGSIGTELSPPSQRLLPPPAHQGISGINQTPPIGASSQLPVPPVYRSAVSDRSELFTREPFAIRDNIATSFGTNRDLLPRGIDSNNSFGVPRTQTYCENIKQNTQFGSLRTTQEFQQEKINNFSTSSCDRHLQGAERFSGFSDTQPLNFVSNQRVATSDIQRQSYSPQQSVFEAKSEPYVSKRSSVTIQAVADSTTKPKKPRGRKKKDNPQEDQKQEQDSNLVNRYIEQEQQLQRFSNNPLQNQRQNDNFIPSSSPIASNIFGQSYNNNSSPNVRDQFQMQNVKNQEAPIACSVSNSSGMSNTYGCSGHLVNMENMGQRSMDAPYRNSPMQQDTYTPQGMGLSGNTNNFMAKNNMFNDGNMSGQNRMMENNQFAFGSQPSQPSFVEQLNSHEFDALELEPGVYSTGNLCNLDTYNAYGQNNFCNNSSSTVDETALSDLISSPHVDRQERFFEGYTEGYIEERPFIAEPAPQSSSVINPIDEDDEFEHLKKPPVVDNKPVAPANVHQQNKMAVSRPNHAFSVQKQPNLKSNSPRIPVQQANMASPQNNAVASQPPEPVESAPVKLPEKTSSKASKNNAFMDSFLSFLQGKKPETLASVNTSVVKKPELPKYYPEPKRPRPIPVEKIDSAIDQKPDMDKSDSNGQSSDSASSSNVAAKITGRVKSIETGNGEHPSLKMKITLQKTPPKPKKVKTKTLKSASKNKRSKSFQESDDDQASGEDVRSNSGTIEGSPSPVPLRRTTSRKAKVQEKKYKESDSEVDDVPLPETYDSDSDPAWTPFAQEKKDENDFYSPGKRGRSKLNRIKGKSKRPFKPNKATPTKAPRIGYPSQPSSPLDSSDTEENDSTTQVGEGFVLGTFVINRQDLNNFEGFPIWRIEAGKMMRKYELFVDRGEICHKSLSTYTSWLPNMEKNYVAIKTKTIPLQKTLQKDNHHVVQVLEEDRPKPKLDSGKATEYEKDPLADMFNVYLQVFLSQAMEPTFLSAIHDSQEDFYIKPLQMIDEIIQNKLVEMNSKVRWVSEFKDTVERRPHIREIERSNLKVLCQATKSATENATKSVHLFGQPYNRTTLQDHPDKTLNQGSVEFLIGKTASNYISAYHNLHHFKYNLFKRCRAKVDIVREGNNAFDNAEILDKCLNNRTWVLKIFEDLKSMLEKG